MNNQEKPRQPESPFPPGKSVEEILLSTPDEFEEMAVKAGKSVDDLRTILAATLERKNAALEKSLEKKNPPVSVDQRAEAVRKEILTALDEIDLFSLDEDRESAEVLEDRAFSSLNKIEDEADEQKRLLLADQAEALFRESQMSLAGKRVSELMKQDKTFKEALSQTADEMYAKVRRDNVFERSRAAREVGSMLFARVHNEEMYRDVERLRKAYREGNPTPEDVATMRKLTLAARGQFLTSALSENSLALYGVSNFSPLMGKLARAYKRAAGFDLSQNNGALGSIEKFGLDLPNSYSSQGSPRSRPRRSSISEERY